jgi:hypothetical protein
LWSFCGGLWCVDGGLPTSKKCHFLKIILWKRLGRVLGEILRPFRKMGLRSSYQGFGHPIASEILVRVILN